MNPPLPGTNPPPYGATPPPSGGGGASEQWPIYLAIGCGFLGLFCLCGIGVSGLVYVLSQNGLGPMGATRVHVTATVQSYLGLGAGVGPGTTCDLPITVETTQAGAQQCHVVVNCAGQVLYGDPSSGFFPCQFSTSPARVVGQDANTTMSDQDAAFAIDTDQRTLNLADDFLGRAGMYTLTATITSVTAE